MGNAETVANIASKQSRNALQRLDSVEQVIQQIIQSLNSTVGMLQQQVSQSVEILNAVTAILGEEVVSAKVTELRNKRLTEEAETNKKQVDELLLQGVIVQVDKVSEKSLIVGHETDKTGTVVHPGRQQAVFARVRPELQAQLTGQGVGFKVETPAGNMFEITEIYDVTDKPQEIPVEVKAVDAPAETPKES